MRTVILRPSPSKRQQCSLATALLRRKAIEYDDVELSDAVDVIAWAVQEYERERFAA